MLVGRPIGGSGKATFGSNERLPAVVVGGEIGRPMVLVISAEDGDRTFDRDAVRVFATEPIGPSRRGTDGQDDPVDGLLRHSRDTPIDARSDQQTAADRQPFKRQENFGSRSNVSHKSSNDESEVG